MIRGSNSYSLRWKERFLTTKGTEITKCEPDEIAFPRAHPHRHSAGKWVRRAADPYLPWRATTTISGASSKPASASGPLRRKLCSSALRNIANSSSASPGWTTPLTSQAPSASLRPPTTSPPGKPTIKPCSAPCSSAILRHSPKSWPQQQNSRKPSTQAHTIQPSHPLISKLLLKDDHSHCAM